MPRNDAALFREAHRRARRALYLDDDQQFLVDHGIAVERVRAMRPTTIRHAVADSNYLRSLCWRGDYTRRLTGSP